MWCSERILLCLEKKDRYLVTRCADNIEIDILKKYSIYIRIHVCADVTVLFRSTCFLP